MNSPFDLSKAPFRVEANADPQQVARDVIVCFRALSNIPDKMTQCVVAAMRIIGMDDSDPLHRAGCLIARDVDTGTGAGNHNPYHNAQHFCEVLLGTLYLSLLAPLQQRERAQLLVAAAVHDFHHDGKLNGEVPFRLERLSVEAAMPHLLAARVAEAERKRITAMVLATEVSTGARFARRCYLHFAGCGPHPELAGIDSELALLAGDERLALQAVLLTEADVLPSVGLTVEYGELQQDKLSREWSKPMREQDKLHFLDHVFGEFTVSTFFSPNLRRLKQAMHQKAKAG